MDLIYRIYRKIGMVLNVNTVGYNQRKYWNDSGKDESLRYQDEINVGDIIFDLGAFEGEFTLKDC